MDIRESGDKTGRLWDVVILEEGMSLNNRFYPAETLEDAVPLFEGCKVFIHKFSGDDYNHLPDNVRQKFPAGVAGNLVGFMENVRFGKKDGKSALLAEMHVEAPWLQGLLKNLWEAGERRLQKMLGLSIDVEGEVSSAVVEGASTKRVDSIDRVYQTDIVTNPAAGGRMTRLKASQNQKREEMNMTLRERLMKLIGDFGSGIVEAEADFSAFPDAKVIELATKVVEALKERVPEAGDFRAALQKVVEQLKAGKADEAMAALMKMLEQPAMEPYRAPAKAAAPQKPAAQAPQAPPTPPKPSVDLAAKEAELDKKLADAAKKIEEAEGKVKKLDEATAKFEEHNMRAACQEASATLEAKMAEAKLPEPSKEVLRESFKDKAPSGEEIDKAVTVQKSLVAKLSETGDIRGMGAPSVEFGRTSRERIEAAVDLMLGYKPTDAEKEKYKGVKAFQGLREAYVAITGDNEVRWGAIRNKRIKEAITTDFPLILGDSVTRKLQQEYRGYPQNWRKISDVVPIKDFRQQRREQLGFMADLDIVAEDDAFTGLANPTEFEATYTAQKRGNLFTVSRELILQDDLRKFRALPRTIARSGHRTLEKFVFNLLTGNVGGGGINTDLIYDAAVLYSVGRANLGTTALGADSLTDGMTQMAQQQDPSSLETLGLSAKWLVVPINLGPTANVLVKSELKPGTANNDVNPNFNAVQVIAVPYLSGDTNNWYLVADPSEQPAIEIGFVNDQQEPEILLQDDPTVGEVFTRERITWKVRHEYGGAIADFRPAQGNIVA